MGYWNIQRIYLNGQGYTRTGQYFGVGDPLYWYANPDMSIEGYERAADRKALITKLQAKKQGR